jgi:hypothetical protein
LRESHRRKRGRPIASFSRGGRMQVRLAPAVVADGVKKAREAER